MSTLFFWLLLYTGLAENQVILLYVGFFSVFTVNIILAIGIFVGDLHQIEGIFLYILFAAIQVIVLVPPLPLESLFIFLSYTVIFYFLIFYSVFL